MPTTIRIEKPLEENEVTTVETTMKIKRSSSVTFNEVSEVIKEVDVVYYDDTTDTTNTTDTTDTTDITDTTDTTDITDTTDTTNTTKKKSNIFVRFFIWIVSCGMLSD